MSDATEAAANAVIGLMVSWAATWAAYLLTARPAPRIPRGQA